MLYLLHQEGNKMKKKILLNLIIALGIAFNNLVFGTMTIYNLVMGKNLQLGLISCIIFIGVNCTATMWFTRNGEWYI